MDFGSKMVTCSGYVPGKTSIVAPAITVLQRAGFSAACSQQDRPGLFVLFCGNWTIETAQMCTRCAQVDFDPVAQMDRAPVS